LRFAALVECGTHVLFGAHMGPFAQSEQALAASVIGALRQGMLCMADRLFYSHAFWRRARETGAELLWRVKNNLRLPVEKRLRDGSYLSTLYASNADRKQKRNGQVVRVIAYRLKGRGARQESYRLITTLLDPARHPALALAGLYPQRWEIETALDEFKTHLRGGRVVLRSKKPELVRQEFYAFLLAHYCVRQLMHEAALANEVEPVRLSYKHAVEVIKRNLPASWPAFPPCEDGEGAWAHHRGDRAGSAALAGNAEQSARGQAQDEPLQVEKPRPAKNQGGETQGVQNCHCC
jgi:hypothetical protein